GRSGGGERPVLPAADGTVLPFMPGSGPGQPHAAVVLAPEVEGGSVERSGALDHARPQGRRERRRDCMDRCAVVREHWTSPRGKPRRTQTERIHRGESVNHLSGIKCKPCDKNGPKAGWRARKDSNL